MARIRYVSYALNKPSGPLDVDSYQHIRGLGPDRWEEYVGACASAAWDKFWADQSKITKTLGIGIPVALFGCIIPIINIVAILFLFAAFFLSMSLIMSAASHSGFVRSYKAYLKRVRGQVVRSRDHEDYLQIYSTEKI